MRITRLFVVLAMLVALVAMAVPASADDLCGTLEGRVQLFVFAPGEEPPGIEAEGVAHTFFDGRYHKVAIIETFAGASQTIQEWHFDNGYMLEFTETATILPFHGPLISFESEVEVTAGGSASDDLSYSGRFNLRSLQANYTVSATEVCFSI